MASVGGSGDEEDDDLGYFPEVLKRPSTFKKRGSDENDDVRGEDDDEYDGEDEEQVDEGEETNDYDDDDPERHSRLLQEITGLPRGAFERKALLFFFPFAVFTIVTDLFFPSAILLLRYQ